MSRVDHAFARGELHCYVGRNITYEFPGNGTTVTKVSFVREYLVLAIPTRGSTIHERTCANCGKPVKLRVVSRGRAKFVNGLAAMGFALLCLAALTAGVLGAMYGTFSERLLVIGYHFLAWGGAIGFAVGTIDRVVHTLAPSFSDHVTLVEGEGEVVFTQKTSEGKNLEWREHSLSSD